MITKSNNDNVIIAEKIADNKKISFLLLLLSPLKSRFFTILLIVAAILSGLVIYVVITGNIPFIGDDPSDVVTLIYLNLIPLLIVALFVIKKIVSIWADRRRGSAGSQMHVRLVLLFSALTVTPTIILSIFSLLFFQLGLESWFSDRVRTALSESQAIANSYLAEHQKSISADALRIARDFNNDPRLMNANNNVLNRLLLIHSELRGITEAIIFNTTGDVKARAGLTFVLEFEPVTQASLNQAQNGDVVLLISEDEDRVRALVKLDQFIEDTYLLIGRYVDPIVLSRTEATRGAIQQFEKLESGREKIQISFALAFILVALLLLLAAVWVGFNFASQLSHPISVLIGATEKIRSGDLSARVPETESGDEIDTLSRAFNRMTNQLETQRKELMEAAQQIDERRRFSEAVLTGVSAGVIGLDMLGRIDLPNKPASALLGVDLDELIGHELRLLVPEMAPLLEKARHTPKGVMVEGEIQLIQADDVTTLFVRIGAEDTGDETGGFVVTFDDVSDLLSAQRKAAWADVARRIAHEIKNPLTPIQLSAERLKRKYLKEIKSDPEIFITCTDTIIRQVGDIGRMVDEFSNFARMPKPQKQNQNLSDLCRQAIFLQRNANTHITYDTELPNEALYMNCDGIQISQVITNLLQNACDAIEGRDKDKNNENGHITLRLTESSTNVIIEVEDNGKGLPVRDREKLTDPYMTTREKGTGLGLAIVKKIMEDHNGRLIFKDSAANGAIVRLEFLFDEQTHQINEGA